MGKHDVRLMVWNCAGGFRRKHSVLSSNAPDIAIIAEASRDFAQDLPLTGVSSLWTGTDDERGLGVIAINGWTLEHAHFDIEQQLFLPCIATRGGEQVNVVAVCSKRTTDYVTPATDALRALSGFIEAKPAIVAGDFNGSASFRRKVPFGGVIDLLDGLGMKSAWHDFRREAFGAESTPTYFMHWSDAPNKGAHIDYAFVSKTVGVMDARLGSFADYPGRKLSDHAAMIVDLRMPEPVEAAAE